MTILEEREKTQNQILAKRDKYEAQGFADKDYQFVFDNKTIKIFLPASVFEQQALLSLGDRVMHDKFVDFDDQIKLTKRFYLAICTHMQIDGNSVNAETLELANLQSYALKYWAELLYPLSLWSDAKAKKAIQTSND